VSFVVWPVEVLSFIFTSLSIVVTRHLQQNKAAPWILPAYR